MRRWCVILVAMLAMAAWGADAAKAGIIFADDFNSGASPLWGNEVGNWAAAGGTYAATSPGNFPNAHSSLPFTLADFTVDVDIKNVIDGGIWLRSTNAPGTSVGIEGVLLVTKGTSLYWHIVGDGSSYGGILNEASGLFSPSSDIHLHIVVAGDTYSVFLNGSSTAATTLTTTTFASGQVALYDFNSAQSFDNFSLSSVPEPSSLILVGLGTVALLGLKQKSRRRPA